MTCHVPAKQPHSLELARSYLSRGYTQLDLESLHEPLMDYVCRHRCRQLRESKLQLVFSSSLLPQPSLLKMSDQFVNTYRLLHLHPLLFASSYSSFEIIESIVET